MTTTGETAMEIFRLIPLVMADIGAVAKTRRNDQQKYQFRGIEDMYQAAHPAMVKHGVFCVPTVRDHKAETHERSNFEGKITIWRHVTITVAHRFYAPDGSFIEVVTMGEGLDNSDKATNKAMSGAMKYALIELFSVPTQDIEDSDKTTPEVGRTTQPTKIGRPAQGGGDATVKGSSSPKPPVSPTPAAIDAEDAKWKKIAAEKSSAELMKVLASASMDPPPIDAPDPVEPPRDREPGEDDDRDDDAAIDLPMQQRLHMEYKDSFKGDKKLAPINMRRNLKAMGYVGPDGEGTTKTIPRILYVEVRKTLLAAANRGGLMQ